MILSRNEFVYSSRFQSTHSNSAPNGVYSIKVSNGFSSAFFSSSTNRKKLAKLIIFQWHWLIQSMMPFDEIHFLMDVMYNKRVYSCVLCYSTASSNSFVAIIQLINNNNSLIKCDRSIARKLYCFHANIYRRIAFYFNSITMRGFN